MAYSPPPFIVNVNDSELPTAHKLVHARTRHAEQSRSQGHRYTEESITGRCALLLSNHSSPLASVESQSHRVHLLGVCGDAPTIAVPCVDINVKAAPPAAEQGQG